MKYTHKTLSDVIRKITLFTPDKMVAIKRGNDSPFWSGRAKFVFGAVTAQAWSQTVIAVEDGGELTKIVLP